MRDGYPSVSTQGYIPASGGEDSDLEGQALVYYCTGDSNYSGRTEAQTQKNAASGAEPGFRWQWEVWFLEFSEEAAAASSWQVAETKTFVDGRAALDTASAACKESEDKDVAAPGAKIQTTTTTQ